MQLFIRLDSFLGRFYHHIGTLVGMSIGLFAVAISLDLILRLLKIGNLPGIQEIIEYFLFTGVFLAAPWVLRIGGHVRVDLLLSNLPLSFGKRLEQILNFFGLLVTLTLLWFGIANLKLAYGFNSMQMKYYNVPEWWILTVFVFSFTLIAIEFFSRMFRQPDQLTADGKLLGDL